MGEGECVWSSGAAGNIDITTDASFSLQDQDLGPDLGSDSGIKIKSIIPGSDFNSENKISKNSENIENSWTGPWNRS